MVRTREGWASSGFMRLGLSTRFDLDAVDFEKDECCN